MIKLTIEMKDEKFEWEYEFPGGCRHHGSEPVSPESLECFVMMIKMCHRHTTQSHKEWMDKVNAGAYLEKTLKASHPKLFEQVDAILRKI